jgi:hypothetical protein
LRSPSCPRMPNVFRLRAIAWAAVVQIDRIVNPDRNFERERQLISVASKCLLDRRSEALLGFLVADRRDGVAREVVDGIDCLASASSMSKKSVSILLSFKLIARGFGTIGCDTKRHRNTEKTRLCPAQRCYARAPDEGAETVGIRGVDLQEIVPELQDNSDSPLANSLSNDVMVAASTGREKR